MPMYITFSLAEQQDVGRSCWAADHAKSNHQPVPSFKSTGTIRPCMVEAACRIPNQYSRIPSKLQINSASYWVTASIHHSPHLHLPGLTKSSPCTPNPRLFYRMLLSIARHHQRQQQLDRQAEKQRADSRPSKLSCLMVPSSPTQARQLEIISPMSARTWPGWEHHLLSLVPVLDCWSGTPCRTVPDTSWQRWAWCC